MVNCLLIENINEIHQCDEVRKIVSIIKKKITKQAEAKLGQAQPKLGLILRLNDFQIC